MELKKIGKIKGKSIYLITKPKTKFREIILKKQK